MSSILVNLYVPSRQELSLLKNPGLQLQKEVPGKFMQIFLSPQSTPVHSLISVQQLKDELGLTQWNFHDNVVQSIALHSANHNSNET